MRMNKRINKLGRILTAGLLASALFLGAPGAALCVRAGTGSSGTKVIRTSSDDEFAQESAKLAKNSRGLSVQSNGEVRKYSSGRLIVRARDGESVDFSRYGASTVIQSTFGVSIVQFSSETYARKAAKSLAALSAVVYVDADDCSLDTGDTQIREISIDDSSSAGQEIPSGSETGILGDLQIGGRTYGQDEDVLFESSVRANASGSSSSGMSWGVSYIQADKYAAFVKANTSQTVKVAVVDSGVSSHSKMKGRILKGRDYVDNDSNPADKNGHGTHVAGTIVDCTPGINVKILPVRVMNASGRGNPSTVGNGIRYAVNQGAKVINLSLGGYSHYRYIEECINYAQSKNVTVVIAAGNECENTKFICPAHMSSPIVVGAINRSGKRAFFSNYGTSLDIVAPGVDIKSCWTGGKYATASGTSMAAPHISAAAAMYRLMNPSASAARIQYLVRCYAKDLGAKGTDNYYGRGVPRMAGAITPSKVTLNKKSTSLQLKKTLTLKASITPSYAGKNKLTWSSSNNGIVTVSGGKLTAKKRGTATITVRTVNGKKATCKVTVTNPVVSTSSAQVKVLQDHIASAFLSKTEEPAAANTAVEKTAAGAPAAGKTAAAKTAADDELTVAAAEYSASEKTASEETASEEAASAAAPSEGSGSAGDPVPGQDTASLPGGTADPVKIYIYPADTADNAPLQDGSIITGSRMQLEAELVPPQQAGELVWTSSDPAVAAIDANGLVTARAQGQTTITAALTAAPSSSGKDGMKKAADKGSALDARQESAAAAGTGSFTIRVTAPSVLTRHASYDAGSAEKQQIEVVLRLPGVIAGEDGSGLQESPSYVLALLEKDEDRGEPALLGAVNLGGADSGSIHLHESSGGALRQGIRSPGDAADGMKSDDLTADPGLVGEKILSSGRTGGKTSVQAGILSVEKMDVDGGKADLTLAVDLDVLRTFAAAEDGSGRDGEVRNCTFAVYTPEAFEELEKAVGDADTGALREMEASALCSCRFTLTVEKTGEPVEDREAVVPAQTDEDMPEKPGEERERSSAVQPSESPALAATARTGEEEPAQEDDGDSDTSSDTEPAAGEDGAAAEEIQETGDASPVPEPDSGTVSGQGRESADEEDGQTYTAREAEIPVDVPASAESAESAESVGTASGAAEEAAE